MFNKKRQGVELSVNTMIIIVLALLVLAVMVYLVFNGAGTWNKGTNCLNQGGTCVGLTDTCPTNKPVPSAYSCSTNQKCCANIGGLGG